MIVSLWQRPESESGPSVPLGHIEDAHLSVMVHKRGSGRLTLFLFSRDVDGCLRSRKCDLSDLQCVHVRPHDGALRVAVSADVSGVVHRSDMSERVKWLHINVGDDRVRLHVGGETVTYRLSEVRSMRFREVV